MMRDQREQVVEALPGLGDGIAGRHEIRGRVTRNLTGDEEPATDPIGVAIVRCLRQPGGQFAFVHGWVLLHDSAAIRCHSHSRHGEPVADHDQCDRQNGEERQPSETDRDITIRQSVGVCDVVHEVRDPVQQ